jgi:hypothetical protein
MMRRMRSLIPFVMSTIRVSSKLICWMYLCKIFIALVYQKFEKVAVPNDFLVIKLEKKTFKRL